MIGGGTQVGYGHRTDGLSRNSITSEVAMDLQTLRLFALYNTKTNAKMNAHLALLREEQWERTFGGLFSSVKSLCNHIYVCDFNWLQRFSGLRPFRYIDRELFKATLRFDTMYLTTVQDYLRLRTELDQLLEAFVDEIRAEDLPLALAYADSHGVACSRNFAGLVLHVFNHQTHHRGMISLYLEEMGIDNDYSNLAALV